MKAMTHTGVVHDHNYGQPQSFKVELRETARFWVSDSGTKYRKVSGTPAASTVWNQRHLMIDSIKPKE